ncbi:N-sulphoglucosamine sulphohydrolase [Aplysia californica]|uniref:N-sulphoglucosamine sulphohydrolase n=1 Tax=Aplysia californica TaxID=6500 RepID=A0ABM0JY52_APLCA|nr:N-sulphoglucosamine sulphohydrolase [Aplysia californica]
MGTLSHVMRLTVSILVTLLITSKSVEGKKNVLVFIGDDAGFLQSAYNNTVCQTPNLDKLAARSLTFTQGYTSVSSCSPSRSVLLSGIPQHQNGMYGLRHIPHHFVSFDDVRSLPLVLASHGIRTGLIGKKHVGPPEVYKFDYERSTDQYINDQIGRNITFMHGFVKEFLQAKDDRPFFLYIGFYDSHRTRPQDIETFGPFHNLWGTGKPGMGLIKDWTPQVYNPDDVIVPYFLPDNDVTRRDIAAMYTSFGRMDQGIGLFLSELEKAGYLDDTLIMFTADNGIAFPNAKTNLYEPGMGEPMMISTPQNKHSWGQFSDALASTMDFTPTILDWFGVPYPDYALNGLKVSLTGRSLLPLTSSHLGAEQDFSVVYSSHDFHEVTMPYPMRVLRQGQYRLIHNLNNRMPYPLASDLFYSPTYMEILNRTKAGIPTKWFKTLQQYYYRDEWELFDLTFDPEELHNLAYEPSHADVLSGMKKKLIEWQWQTNDPWVCMPHGVLILGQCYPMLNEPAK